MEGTCGEISLPLCAALTDKDASLFTGGGVKGGSTAVDCPLLLGSCLLAEESSPPFPPGGAPTAGVSGPSSGVVPPTDSPLA